MPCDIHNGILSSLTWRNMVTGYEPLFCSYYMTENNFLDWGKVYSGDNIKKCYILVLSPKTCSLLAILNTSS